MLTDYHIHTPLCQHAIGTPAEYVRAAQKAGLDEIGFADHNPMPTQYDNWRMSPEQLPEYFRMIDEVRKEFPNYPVRLGLECDFIVGYEDHIRNLAKQASWDYFIGSVHYVSTPREKKENAAALPWDVDNPKHLNKWEEEGIEEVWTLYFQEYTRMASSRLYDFLAHPDLVKKFRHLPEGDLSRFYKDTITAIADHGLTLEVSTAGLRKEIGEIYPSRQYLELAFKNHIPIVINSDSHEPGEVAHEFKQAVKLVKEVGYTHVNRFKNRKPIPTLLPAL